MRYDWGMRVKTSITLDQTTLDAIDKIAGGKSNRSRIIERAVRDLIARERRAARDARDRDILDANADVLNNEMHDVLGYQVKI